MEKTKLFTIEIYRKILLKNLDKKIIYLFLIKSKLDDIRLKN